MKWVRIGNDFVNLAYVLRISFSADGRTASLYLSEKVKFEVNGRIAAELAAWLESNCVGAAR